MSRTFRTLLVAAGLLTLTLSVATTARAAITTGNLFANVVNELEDDDFDLLVNAGGTIKAPGAGTVVDVGDFVFGVFRITALRVPPGGAAVASATDTEASFTGYLALKVASKSGAGVGAAPDGFNDANFMMVAPTLAEWAVLFAGDPTLASYIPVNPGTMLVVHEDPDNISQGLATADAVLKTVSGPKLWEIGIDPTNLTPNSWTVQSDTDDVATAFLAITGSFSANLDLLGQFAGPPLNPIALPLGGTADVLLRNGSFGSAAPGAPAFGISSDVDALINPAPEPATLAVWAGLGGIGLAVGLRRRRKA